MVMSLSNSGRWQALLDTMPHDHRKIEEWAAKLEATLDEQDERKRRDANFDPKNLPPYAHSPSNYTDPRTDWCFTGAFTLRSPT